MGERRLQKAAPSLYLEKKTRPGVCGRRVPCRAGEKYPISCDN